MSEVLLSVLMPAYNSEKYIEEAINSVLHQTFSDFEFLIIDDGSTDNTIDVILKFSDSRIRLIRNEENRGLIYSLNVGLEEAKGKYVARMDADDICYQTRFEKQIKFMDNHPEISVLGTAHRVLGTEIEVHHPKFDEEIKLQMFRKSAHTHPTIMIRQLDLLNHNLFYKEEYRFAEDYGLWAEVAGKGLQLANLEEVLLDYRHHDGQITIERRKEQLDTSARIQSIYFRTMTSEILSDDDIARFISFPKGRSLPFRENILILDKIYRANSHYYKFHSLRFLDFISSQIYDNLQDKNLKKSDLLFTLRERVSLKLIVKILKIYLSKL